MLSYVYACIIVSGHTIAHEMKTIRRKLMHMVEGENYASYLDIIYVCLCVVLSDSWKKMKKKIDMEITSQRN